MQALQSAGSSLTSPFQSLTQLFSAPMSMFGSASGMGNLLGGGSTGNSFSPTSMAKAGGLPLGTNGLGGGGGVGLGGGGLGAYGGGLSGANKSGASTMARTSVLSGVSTMTQERFAGAPTAGFGGGGIPLALLRAAIRAAGRTPQVRCLPSAPRKMRSSGAVPKALSATCSTKGRLTRTVARSSEKLKPWLLGTTQLLLTSSRPATAAARWCSSLRIR
ncbi:Uncharacterised protein [Mycobacteroides abscessus]|nr:Uncharacterised protein [Mycobacteroides abscessus]